jgi:serine/threonine protein phosphatase PrpC
MNNLENALSIVRLSDTGKLRKRNEDSIASDASIGMAVLADGMGGYNAGDVASQMRSSPLLHALRLNLKMRFKIMRSLMPLISNRILSMQSILPTVRSIKYLKNNRNVLAWAPHSCSHYLLITK